MDLSIEIRAKGGGTRAQPTSNSATAMGGREIDNLGEVAMETNGLRHQRVQK